MRGSKKNERISRRRMEDEAATRMGENGTSTERLLAMIFIRQGEMLSELQELTANSFFR